MDSLFALKIICELDEMSGGEAILRLDLKDYQVYNLGGKELCELVDRLYVRYLKTSALEVL